VLLSRVFGLCFLTASAAVAQTGEGYELRSDAPAVRAASEGAGHGTVTALFGYFDRPDSDDGNPFLDEELTVIEPVVVFDYNVTDRFSLGATFSYDHVSSASIDRLSDFPDQSGASGDNYYGADVHASYRASEVWTVGGHAGYSTEYDYDSIGVGLNATQELEDADATLSYSVDAFFDDVDIIRFDGTEDGSDDRISVSGTLRYYQILTPEAHGEFGTTFAWQNGFLETPYNAVVIEDPNDPPNPNLENNARGTEITEELPDDRYRLAVFGRVRQSLGEGFAAELGARGYQDDWGITSLTLEPRYYQSLTDELDMRLRYRYYTQSEADHYDKHFDEVDRYRTQDSDLGDYDIHTVGGKLTWFANASNTLALSADYGFRSDGLDQFFGSVGWTWAF